MTRMRWWTCGLLGLALAGCGGGGDTPPTPEPPPRPVVSSVRVSPDTNSLFVGNSLQLSATALDANGNAVPGQVTTWRSASPDVATIGGSGVVTAVRVGVATIFATSGGQTGTATIAVSNPPPPDCDASVPVTIGTPVQGRLAVGDCVQVFRRYADRYRFSLTETTLIRITMVSAELDAFLTLQNATTGAVITRNDDGNGGTDSRIERALPAGQYVVVASSFSENETGGYTLSVSAANPSCLTTTPLPANTLVSGTLSTSSCDIGAGAFADRYQLTLPISSIVTLTMRSTAVDALFFVENSAGDLMVRDDDGGGGTDARVTFELDAGTYIVSATSFGTPVTGAYTLRADTEVNLCGANATLTAGTPVRDTLTSSGCRLSDGSAAVRYRFNVPASRTIRLDLSSTAFDPYLVVQRVGTATALFEDDDSGPGLDAQVLGTFAAGDYVVTATAATTDGRGAFTLSATGTAPAGVSVSVTPASATVGAGLTQQLAATVTGDANTAVSWRSSAPAVATVSETGLVRAVAAGTATITATSLADPSRSASSTVTVTATGVINLDIPFVYLVQSVQEADGRVPLIAGKPTVARVFVRASRGGIGGVPIAVRLRVFNNGTLSRTLDGVGFGASPVNEACCSADIPIPPELVRDGISLSADVDVTNQIEESNETDNTWPATGTSKPATLLPVPAVTVQLIPIRHRESGLTGPADTLATTLLPRMLPVAQYRVTLHPEYVTDLARPTTTAQWSALLREVEALRSLENGRDYYYGLLSRPTASGVIGIATLRGTTALGIGAPTTLAQETFAHEFGHLFGRSHAPTPSTCGSPGGVDPNYPRANGQIGIVGYDVAFQRTFDATAYDVMGYCDDPWISEYTYFGILAFLRSASFPLSPRVVTDGEQPVVLLSGSVDGSSIALDPAYALSQRPTPSAAGGRYVAEGFSADGRRLFRHQFDARAVTDGDGDVQVFTVHVPYDADVSGSIARISVTDTRGVAMATQLAKRVPGELAPGVNVRITSADDVVARRTGSGAISVTWNATRYPSAVLRDRATRRVLAIGRTGTIEARASDLASLELLLSDGTSSITRSLTGGEAP
jgi:hypothetical protein